MTGIEARPEVAHHTSIANAEFSAALTRLRARPVTDDRLSLRVQYRLPGAPTGRETDPRDDPQEEVGQEDDHPNSPAGGSRGGPITRALEALAAGEVTSRALLEQSLAAIAARDDELHAVVAIDADQARAQADRLDQQRVAGKSLGPLAGVPLTIKDVIDVAGLETRAGSAAYRDRPTVDATAVDRLRAAGAIILAKVSTHEFALGVTNPQSRNPHDTMRIPGGSSGGSAIAVATGMGLGSLGTDTRASIRVPSSLSGVVGIKPTFATVPTTGVVSLSWTMDHVGPLAASVPDAALMLDVLRAPSDPDRPPSLHLATIARQAASRGTLAEISGRPLRLGVPDAGYLGGQPDVIATVVAAVDHLVELGAQLRAVDRPGPADFDDANALGLIISRTEAAAAHRRLGTDLTRCWAETADQLRAAAAIAGVDYLDAQRRRGQLADELLAVFADIDVLALPTTLVTAPRVTDATAYLMTLSRNAIPFSLVGFPAMSLPCGRDRAMLPIGLQLVAAPHREDLLVAVGAAFEATRA